MDYESEMAAPDREEDEALVEQLQKQLAAANERAERARGQLVRAQRIQAGCRAALDAMEQTEAKAQVAIR